MRELKIPAWLFLTTVITRLPFTSKFLYNIDSVQFALSMDHFDISRHLPHPPGYFLYVMLGKLTRMFTGDANMALIALSIFFSGLTVVMLYCLGREMFDEETGMAAAVIAITSPLLWFHGEVALSYIAEAFMSALVAYLCYKMLMGSRRFFWLSAITLGIAGGFRQNTMVFLMPLWFYSMKDLGLKRIALSLLLFGIAVLAWFIPMIKITGGYETYRYYLNAQWTDVVWHGIHLSWIGVNSYCMLYFTMSGLGVFLAILIECTYFGLRKKIAVNIDRTTALFILLWLLPGLIFHIIIYTFPFAPGYILISLIGFFVLTGKLLVASSNQIAAGFPACRANTIGTTVLLILAVANSLVFFFYPFPNSAAGIKEHDRLVSSYIEAVRKNFSPADTEIIGFGSFTFSYRHAMYYLPEYRVHGDMLLTTPDGPRIFAGFQRKTSRPVFVRFQPSTRRVLDFSNYRAGELSGLPSKARAMPVMDGYFLAYYDSIYDLYDARTITPSSIWPNNEMRWCRKKLE